MLSYRAKFNLAVEYYYDLFQNNQDVNLHFSEMELIAVLSSFFIESPKELSNQSYQDTLIRDIIYIKLKNQIAIYQTKAINLAIECLKNTDDVSGNSDVYNNFDLHVFSNVSKHQLIAGVTTRLNYWIHRPGMESLGWSDLCSFLNDATNDDNSALILKDIFELKSNIY